MNNQVITRAQIEKALVETAWSFFLKGDKLQYESQELNLIGGTLGGGTIPLRKHWDGASRTSKLFAPENATSDTPLYTVCSDYTWKVYRNTLNYPILGHALNALTKGLWSYTEAPQDIGVIRWVEDPNKTCQTVCGYPGSNVTEKHRVDLKTMQDFLLNWDKNMRPGDLLINFDHTMLYIGGGFVVDAWGYKYDMNTGIDRFERKGTVCTLHRIEEFIVNGTDLVAGKVYQLGASEVVKFFAVLRPLNALTIPANTGDIGDDTLDPNYVLPKLELRYPDDIPLSGYTITPATYSRLQYPGLDIDRTVDISAYGTAQPGGTLTYSVNLMNKSDHPDYDTYWSAINGEPYYGQDYTDLVVTETVPAGTELVRASGNATVNGDTITWKLNIPAGGAQRVFYTVRVTGEVGSLIVNDGGFVADIPSNCITNVIGGKKLSNPAAVGIREFYNAEAKREEKFGVSIPAEPTRYANDIYAKCAGLKLDIPGAQDLLDNLFDHIHVVKPSGYFTNCNNPHSVWMYTPKTDVDPAYKVLSDMAVRGYVGGLWLYTEPDAPRINEFSMRYMEPGDVVVGMKLSPDTDDGARRTVESSKVVVYMGNDQCLALSSDGTLTQHVTDEAFWPSFIDDIFICLRPRQGYEDINQNKI